MLPSTLLKRTLQGGAPVEPAAENVVVPASHAGLGVNPLALYALADRLAQPEGAWRPFERRGLRRWLYADPGRLASEAVR
jgi:hypothetical protein